MISASSAGHLDAVRLLLGKGASPHHVTDQGRTALHYACSKKNVDVVKLLLKEGASVNVQDASGSYPIHRAVAGGDEGILAALLKHGASVNVQNNHKEVCYIKDYFIKKYHLELLRTNDET